MKSKPLFIDLRAVASVATAGFDHLPTGFFISYENRQRRRPILSRVKP